MHEAADDADRDRIDFKDLGVEMTARYHLKISENGTICWSHANAMANCDIKKWRRAMRQSGASTLKGMEEKDENLYDSDSDFMNESDASTTNSLSRYTSLILAGPRISGYAHGM